MKHFKFVYCFLAIASFACDDSLDIAAPANSNNIRFATTVSDNGTTASRSSGIKLGCAEDIIALTTNAASDSLYLLPETVDWTTENIDMASRSNMVHSNSGMYSAFNVSAYYYTDDWSDDKAKYKPNYFYSESATGTLTSGYSLDNQRYWPSSGKMRFVAFAPFETDNSGAFTLQNVDEQAGTYIHISVDQDVSRHKDLLVAYSEELDCNESRPAANLNFKHALSCIQFVLASDMEQSRIKKIAIKNVNYVGDMRFSDNMADKSAKSSAESSLNDSYYLWSGQQDFTLDLTDSQNSSGLEVAPGDLITDENHSFMMFPQIVPDGATVEITLSRKKDNGEWGADEVMFGYISGKHWPAGKIIRYRVSKERWWQELQVSTLPAFSPMGGDQYFSITSYDNGSNGEIAPVKWTVKYEDPNNPDTFIDSKPDWYAFDTINSGDTTPRSIKVTATALEDKHSIDLDAALKSVGTYGSQTAPYNLSTNSANSTSVGTTANCYIVDRPGWYIFPMVYGNAIVNGAENSSAYNPNVSEANGAIGNFVNYAGDNISSPYILTDCASVANSITGESAKIIWQDKQNLVRSTNISVDKTAFGGNGGIVFEIADEDIAQGNFVIGLEIPGQTGKMIWSWHIWVTPFFRPNLDPILSETIGITNHDGQVFNVLYTNLGWCSLEPIDLYNARTSKVQFTAETSDGRTLTKIMTVRQGPFVKYWQGKNTYYQWGRKDPFPPFIQTWTESWYDGDGNLKWQNLSSEKFGNQKDGLTGRIVNPIIFHTSDDKEIENSDGIYEPVNFKMYTNLWDATYSSKPVVNVYNPKAIEPVTVPSRNNVKTVYDPCPPGYKVPPIDTFTGFTTTGNNIAPLTDNPQNWNGILMNYSFDCGNNITNPYIYIFYTNSDKTDYIAMPLSGYRNWQLNSDGTAGSPYQMGVHGYSWTAGAASEMEGYYIELQKESGDDGFGCVRPLNYFWQTDGLPIRPCRE